MAQVRAGWALHGKRAGQYSEYEVLAASNWPVGPEDFQRIVHSFNPGNPPSGQPAPGEDLPWITFGPMTMDGEKFLCVIDRSWSGEGDWSGRQILRSVVFCFPVAELAGARVSLAALSEAMAGRLAAWTPPDTLSGDPITITVPEPDVEALADNVRRFDLARVCAAAAAALDGNVVVLGGRELDTVGRIAFLDAVTVLLPAGARTWFTATTWADSASRKPLRMTFTNRAKDGELKFAWSGPRDELRDGAARRYREELERLCREKEVPAVIRHLAGVGIEQADPGRVLSALMAMDFAAAVLRRARFGEVSAADVRQLARSGELGDMRPADRQTVLGMFLTIAAVEDLDLVRDHWAQGLASRAVEMAGRVFDEATGARLLAFGREVGLEDRVLAEILRAGGNRAQDWLITQAVSADAPESIVHMVQRRPELLVRLLVNEIVRDPDAAVETCRRLAGNARHTALIRAMVLGDVTVTYEDILALERVSRDATLTVLTRCGQRWPERLRPVVRPVIEWLRGNPSATATAADQDRWATVLRNAQDPAADAYCYLLGAQPRQSPVQQFKDPATDAETYTRTFVATVRSARPMARARVFTSVLANVNGVREDVCRLLAELSRSFRLGELDNAQAVVRAVQEAVRRVPELAEDGVFADLLPKPRPAPAPASVPAPEPARTEPSTSDVSRPRAASTGWVSAQMVEDCLRFALGETRNLVLVSARVPTWLDIRDLYEAVVLELRHLRANDWPERADMLARSIFLAVQQRYRWLTDAETVVADLDFLVTSRVILLENLRPLLPDVDHHGAHVPTRLQQVAGFFGLVPRRSDGRHGR